MRLVHTKTGRPGPARKSRDWRLMSDVPPAPAHFDKARQAIWAETAGILIARADLSEGDLGTLEMYANSLAEMRELIAILKREGFTQLNKTGQQVQHPAFSMKKSAEVQVGFAATALGLTPKGRSSLKREAAPIDDTPLAETAKASAF